ncbi:hypothetical protein ABE28_011715 [Peribacillus muralis]|uniref:Uncharacterized protein n=1 Tax=Peribacillus muralis TaxID=264697 RepID=A0A1B3XP82_9BACI|nr:hypothetical protein [Peribacillus muralis]AOH55019.1 hypothetical protein ABE28_011715 [Peribacillus muralis]
MKEVTRDQLIFKEHLSMIEQFSLKDFMFKWLGSPDEGLDDLLPLTYTEQGFAKMETTPETTINMNNDETFRYVTITKDNQIVMGGLCRDQESTFRILSLDERLGNC